MNEQDPARREMQPPIPTHPPDPAANGDEEKIVGAPKDEQDSTLHSVGLAPGAPLDPGVGGPGLGQAPSDQDAAGQRVRDTRNDAPDA